MVTLHLHDDGGTADGGDDTSPTQTFTISISSINHVPSFTKGSDQTDNEDAGAQSVSGWATAISQGADDTGQTLTFVVDSNYELRPVQLAARGQRPSGTLTYTPSANANGSASITLLSRTTAAPPTTATTRVRGRPSRSTSPRSTTHRASPRVRTRLLTEDTGLHTVAGWATAPVTGPPDEIRQIVDFVIDSNSKPSMFASSRPYLRLGS